MQINQISFKSISNHLIESLLFSFGISVLIQIMFYFLNLNFSIIPFFVPFIIYPLFTRWIKKQTEWDINIIFSYLIIALLSLLFILYFRQFIEHSFDGNMYHGEAMIQMLWGWNPIHNTNAYASSYGFEWAKLYPKFTWIYSAFWIQLTGISSSGMFLNAFIGIITSLKAYLFAKEKTQSKLASWIVAIIVLLNPIFIEQLHTFYVDALMSNLLLLLIIYNLELADDFNLSHLFYIGLISVLLINIKFTGFAVAGLIDLATFTYLMLKRRSYAVKYFIGGVFIIFFGVGVFGYSPYVVNLLNGRHIFFPLLGPDKWDIITSLIPEPMLQLRSYERFLYSLRMGSTYLENLFTIKEYGYLYYDQRIGGFGSQALKLFILATGIIVTYIIVNIKKIKLHETLMLILFGMTIMINFRNIWWARYATQLWYIIPFAIIILLNTKKTLIIKIPLVLIILSLVLFQSQDIYKHTYERDRLITEEARVIYKTLRERDDLIFFVDGGGTDQFTVFEEFKSRENGVDIKTVLYDFPTDPYECFRIDNYKICVVIENEAE